MFGLFGNKFKDQEQEMANWLAHPSEFGVPPKSVKHRRAYHLSLMHYGPTVIHLIDYQMPDGTRGRGFVNPLTWSFLGDQVNQIPDDQIVAAYCGWAFLFPGLQAGSVRTDFVSEGEEQRYIADLTAHGLANVAVHERYRIGTSEIFGYTADYQGQSFRGAGNTESEVAFPSGDPRYHLPAVYFLLGQQVIQS
jgi:hypothetical protein